MTYLTSTAAFTSTARDHEGPAMLLLDEALARSRQQRAERAAREYALARQLTAGRRWARLSAFAAKRAERARADVPT